MPRGRKIIGPSPLTAPCRPDDADGLISAAFQGWLCDARARSWPPSLVKKTIGRSWIDAAHHPHDPRQRGQPPDHYLPLLVRAVRLLMLTKSWTQYRARRHVADRLLAHTSAANQPELIVSVLGVPPRIFAISDENRRHAEARKSIMSRLRIACRAE